MLHQETTAAIMNNSSEAAQHFSEFLPKVERLNIDLGIRIKDLHGLKANLFDKLHDELSMLPNEMTAEIYTTLSQIQTLEDCVSESITSEDFYNLDNFIFCAKRLYNLHNV